MNDKMEKPCLFNPGDFLNEAENILSLSKGADREFLRNVIAAALCATANGSTTAVWAGINEFLNMAVDSGKCRDDLLPGIKAVQMIVSECYADIMKAIEEKMNVAREKMKEASAKMH